MLISRLDIKVKASRSFANTYKGFGSFCSWFGSKKFADVPVGFTMEATGVYYEGLAYFLYGQNLMVHVVLPNHAKKYGQSLGIRSKTDKIDAAVLARTGLELKLPLWRSLTPELCTIKQLCREKDRLITERTAVKNHLHSYCHQGIPAADSIDRCKKHIDFLDCQIAQIEKQVKTLVKKNKELTQPLGYLLSIKWVGLWTAIIIVCETNGFASIRNSKQLTSYAGLDIKLAESGKWKGKSKISKQGNKYIRKALYFPAFTMAKHDLATKQYYQCLIQRKGKAIIAVVAVQRKLLALMYTLWKKQQNFVSKINTKTRR